MTTINNCKQRCTAICRLSNRPFRPVNATSSLIFVLAVMMSLNDVSTSTVTDVAWCPEGCLCSNSTGHVTCDDQKLDSFPVFSASLSDTSAKITSIDASRNSIRRVDGRSFSSSVSGWLSNVVELKIRQNLIEYIEVEAFQGEIVTSLQVVELAENHLSELKRGTFSSARQLLHVDLSSNRLSTIDGAFDGLRELTRLDLRGNRLTILTGKTLAGLGSLRYLRLDDNSISLVEPKAFVSLESLAYLAMKGNPLGSGTGSGNNDDGRLHFHFRSSSLSYVDLSECQLRRVPRGLPSSVRYLQLRRNLIRRLERQSLGGVAAEINILVLDENELEFVEDGTLALAANLQQLWLNGNRLRSIPRPLPVGLQKLFIDSNQLTQLDDDAMESFTSPERTSSSSQPRDESLKTSSSEIEADDKDDGGSQLTVLSLMSNNISVVSPKTFGQLRRLQSVDLAGNFIRRVFPDTFSANSRLRTLSLSNNPIEAFDERSLRGLSSDLESLSLSYIPSRDVTVADSAFPVPGKLTSLRRLDLDSSPGLVQRLIETDGGRLLDSFRAVRDLTLLSIEMETLPFDFFADKFPELTLLHLSSTRWRCDQSLLWLRNWLLSETTVHVERPEENIRCSTPPAVNDRPLTSLLDHEFATVTSSSVQTRRPSSGTGSKQQQTAKQPKPSTTVSMSSAAAKTTTILPISLQVRDLALNRSSGHRKAFDINEHLPPEIDSRAIFRSRNEPSAPVTADRLSAIYSARSGVSQRTVALASSAVTTKPEAAAPQLLDEVVNDMDVVSDARGQAVLIALAIVFVTTLVAAILLSVIVYLCRKQNKQSPSACANKSSTTSSSVKSSSLSSRQNGGLTSPASSTVDGGLIVAINDRTASSGQHLVQTPDIHKKDVVYFLPATNGKCSPVAITVAPSNGSLIKSTVVERRKAAMTNSEARTTELVDSGVKQNGPLRVYKWEDF